MSQCYEYMSIFREYGSKLREMFISSPDIPYPVYETRSEYEQSSADFKGILVWKTQQYYYSIVEPDPSLGSEEFTNDVGFYIIPEFGEVNIIPNLEYKQTIVITFDFNSEPDFDPYQSKMMYMIDWFLNKHAELIESIDNGLQLSTGTRLFCHVEMVSPPITDISNYIRRAVTLTVRYCKCG